MSGLWSDTIDRLWKALGACRWDAHQALADAHAEDGDEVAATGLRWLLEHKRWPTPVMLAKEVIRERFGAVRARSIPNWSPGTWNFGWHFWPADVCPDCPWYLPSDPKDPDRQPGTTCVLRSELHALDYAAVIIGKLVIDKKIDPQLPPPRKPRPEPPE